MELNLLMKKKKVVCIELEPLGLIARDRIEKT